MFKGKIILPPVKNEPLKDYAKGSEERKKLLQACDDLSKKFTEIPVIINGEEIKTEIYQDFTMPGDHSTKLFRLYSATPELIKKAIDGALKAKKKWENLPMEHKCAIFLKAGDLVALKYRDLINAATMLGQGKTMWQSEIDAAAEVADLYRFNAHYAVDLFEQQPEQHVQATWNRMEYRALDGFVVAISPFNFTALGSNLVGSPLQMGNVVVWKPSKTSALSNYFIYKILEEAGVPKGVLQFLPTLNSSDFSKIVFDHPDFSALHFTGSTATFQMLWKTIGENLQKYKSYPRIVGETGGKNFHLFHPSGDLESFVYGSIRGAFEYSGQKCSATSRCYIPESVWPKMKDLFIKTTKTIKVGLPHDPTSFTSSVIDKPSFDKVVGYIERAKKSPEVEVIVGGTYSSEKGWYIDPTILLTTNPKYESMVEEIFGPVLSIYVFKDEDFDKVIDLIDESTDYGLTGSIYSRDRYIIEKVSKKLQHTAGNFYINDKCTGAMVAQQPFGGSRLSGTNDKSGAQFCLLRWTSVRTIKETFLPTTGIAYPSTDM